MGLHRKESQSFNGFGKILTKTIKITKTEIETKEKPQILHFQVKNTGFCQQSGRSASSALLFFPFFEQCFSAEIINQLLCRTSAHAAVAQFPLARFAD